MSFHISEVENSSFLSKEMNKFLTSNFYLITPSEKLLSEQPFSNHLEIKPTYCSKVRANLFLQASIDFDIHSSDVFVCSLPKCGSSWVQTIVWLLKHDLNYEAVETLNRLDQLGDFDEIEKINAAKKMAKEILEKDVSNSLNEIDAHEMAWNEVFKTLDTPRVFKTHSPIYFLPKAIWSKGARVVYVVRNPKDMIVSLYHYMRNTFHNEFKLDDAVDGMTSDTLFISPVLNYILNFWRVRNLSNVLFVAYEDLVTDAFATIKKISKFLECKYTDEQLIELTEYSSFDNMKKNKAINREEDIIRTENIHGKMRPDVEFT